MAIQTSFLPHFPHLLQGKAKPSQASLLAQGIDHFRHLSLPDLSALLGPFFPQNFFSSAPDSKPERESIYTPTTLFWAFLFQVLHPGMPARASSPKSGPGSSTVRSIPNVPPSELVLFARRVPL
jgi:hypothetical protein